MIVSCTIRENFNKVVFVSESPLSQRDAKLYGFNSFRRAGLLIEVWDVTDIYLPGARNQYTDEISDVTTIRFSNEEDLVRAIKKLQRNDVVFCFSGDATHQLWSHRTLLRGLSKSPALFAGLSAWHLPMSNSLSKISQNHLHKNRFQLTNLKRNVKVTIQAVRRSKFGDQVLRLCVRAVGIGAFDHVWAGTRVSEISPFLRPDPTAITFIHSLDYDQFRNLPKSEFTEPFICFIANPGGLGGDHTMMIPDPSQLQAFTHEYFHRLNEVLKVVESRFRMPVVIAAHPRVAPQLYEPWVEGRKVVHDQTNTLIAQAALVIAQSSTSIAVAALMHKPILLVFLGDFSEIIDSPLREGDYISEIKSRLGCATIDWFESDWPDKLRTMVIEANLRRYDAYVAELMKLPGTPDRPFWEVVLDTKLTRRRP